MNFLLFRSKLCRRKSFLIVRANRSEYQCINNMLWKYYYPDEPTVACLGLGNKFNPIFEQEGIRCLSEGYTLVAKCKHTGAIVGASVNTTSCPWDPDHTDKFACAMTDTALKNLYHFHAYVQRAPLLWEKYCTNKIFEINMVFVRREDRRRGVSSLLINASRQLGADCGYAVVRCDATNVYTSRTCEKLKMKKIFYIPYCSYTGLDPARTPVIKVPLPHKGVGIYIDLPLYNYK